ncbi:MAG: DUF692 domain-containing protein [Tatlockia sp.]|nr:DUF692 domain-containing protein [Tatlockia sp.]
MKNQQQFPYLGFGLGLRTDHYDDILKLKPNVDWFEILTENYLIPGGKPLYFLDKVRENYPIVMHGVSLSIGSTDPLDWDYLKQVKTLAERVKPVWISDHLCWTGVKGLNMHDLLPIPYTTEAVSHISARIREIQDFLGRRILIENVSSYLTYMQSEMTEWDFISAIANEADCSILLDVNNIYVSSVNHEFDPDDYINSISPEHVVQIHLAGHSNEGNYIIDTHDAPIINPVWDLYAKTIARFGKISTMIERDDNIPPLSVLLDELDQARAIMENTLSKELLA